MVTLLSRVDGVAGHAKNQMAATNVKPLSRLMDMWFPTKLQSSRRGFAFVQPYTPSIHHPFIEETLDPVCV